MIVVMLNYELHQPASLNVREKNHLSPELFYHKKQST